MRPKALLSLVLLVGAASAFAQSGSTVTISFGDDGDRQVWTQAGLPTSIPADVVKTQKSVMDFSTAGKKSSDTIYVWDVKSGRLATSTVGSVQAKGNWTVAPEDYKFLAEAKVKVTHNSLPLIAGSVRLVDAKKRSQERFLTPSANGEVAFYAIPAGDANVTVTYPTKAGETKTLTQILKVDLSASAPSPMAIAVPEEVDTAGAAPGEAAGTNAAPDTAAPKGTAPAPATKKDEASNPVGSVIVYLFGLAVAIGVGLLAMKYAKQNQDLVQSKLQQLGVDIPQPGDEPLNVDPVPVPMPKKPEPPQKIMLEDSAPEPLAASAPYAAAPLSSTVVLTGEPKLVGDAGDAMPLPEGETVVGREVGLGLSLVGESTVSRRHAQLTRNGGDVTLTDLGSTNGTFVNGQQLQGSTTLRPGDSVQFGAVRFRYEG